MNKIIKNIAICGIISSAALFTSCDDFLTIFPASSIVEEDFWKDKNDLKNAVMGCYKQVVSNEMLNKYIYWGEERSDNFERSTSEGAAGQVANIMNANLLPTYAQFDWAPAYKAINYCNKVLAHGPEVVDRDEAFSHNEWLPIRAEVVTLRALCHFYLVRTFGEIPYVTEDYNNDSQELRLAQSTQLYVLNNIIKDLEEVAVYAMNDYGNTVENKGRVTKKAIYSLLADVYLWRASYIAGNNHPFNNRYNYTSDFKENRVETYPGTAEDDYRKCVEYCDKVIEIATDEKIYRMNQSGENIGGGDVEIYLEDLLEQNVPSTTHKTVGSSSKVLDAYKYLFGRGNSEESIFELQVEGTSYGNTMITGLFWNINDNRAGSLTGSTALFEGVESTPNTTTPTSIYTKTDYRRWENLQFTKVGQTSFDIGKYINTSATQTNGTTSTMVTDNAATTMNVTYETRTTSYLDANFIIYRMSEIFLMKAEAMSQLSEDEENLKAAFEYVREVFKRSNPYAYEKNNRTAKDDSLSFETFNTSKTLESLIMTERQREFLGEGKRWFDLVRYAQRRGSTSEMLELLTRKYASNSKAVKSKLANMQSLFSPVYNEEMKNNDLLYQNGQWKVNESTQQTDRL